MTFGNWTENLHNDQAQQKRIASARSANTTPSSVDKNFQTAVFPGSGAIPYTTTLDSCTCVDFARRKAPCKHIYRLAIELGLLDLSAKSGINKNNQKQMWYDVVSELENLTDKSQFFLMQFLRQELIGKTEYIIPAKVVGDDLLCFPFIRTIDAPLTILESFKREEIIHVLDEHGIVGFKRNMSIHALSEWCLENVPDILNYLPHVYVFCFSDSSQVWHKKVLTYLRRKYDSIAHSYLNSNDHLCTIVIPYGVDPYSAETEDESIQTDHFQFPSDDISRLLNQYGHNRRNSSIENAILGKSFVFTGEFMNFTNYEMRRTIEALGGTVFRSIHHKTSYVIAGENTDIKLQDVKEMGIPVLTEDEFLALIDSPNGRT